MGHDGQMYYDCGRGLVWPGEHAEEVVAWVRSAGQLAISTDRGWAVRDYHYRMWLSERPGPDTLRLWSELAIISPTGHQWRAALLYSSPPSPTRRRWRLVGYRHPLPLSLRMIGDALDADQLCYWEGDQVDWQIPALLEMLTHQGIRVSRSSVSSWSLGDLDLETLCTCAPPVDSLLL